MPAAPVPNDEAERLALLRLLNLLDSAPEPVFDRVTRLVTRMLDVPVALISLIDSDRQWFKSCVGLNIKETPREDAFCTHAILQDEPLIVQDATQDPRFENNRLVRGAPAIRFYAGIPIRTEGGVALGTLCAIDRRPRALTAEELDTLQDLADLVTKEIQIREAVARTRSELNRSEAVLQASEARYRSMFDRASVGIARIAPNGLWLDVNEALCNIVGYSAEELRHLTFQELTHPDDLSLNVELFQHLNDDDLTHYQMEKRYRHKDGHYVWIDLNVTKKARSDGQPEYFVSVIQDIHARKAAEEALASLRRDLEARVLQRTQELRQREAELTMVIENAYDAYVSTDETGLIKAWNREAEETFGWRASEALGRAIEDLIIPPELRDQHRQGMARYLKTGMATVLDQRLEVPAQRRDGTRLVVELRIRALNIGEKRIFSAFLHDITERKAMEARREYEATHDALTGLLNRRAFMDMLPQAQARSDRNGKSLALLFIDLDGFKAVNDSLGHEAGDALLKKTAQLLTGSVRRTDSVVRLAGDEFTVVLEGLNAGPADAWPIAEKILSALAAPMLLPQGLAQVAASIGIAIHVPGSGRGPDFLIREADKWMYEAKRAGKGRVLPKCCGQLP